MIIVVNNSGIGNRIKNLVSALRKGHLYNDMVLASFNHGSLFQYAQCIDTSKTTQEIYSTWHLELLPEDFNKEILKTDSEFILIHDQNQIFHLSHHIDFQYENINEEIRDDFLRYFNLIHFNENILNYTENIVKNYAISDCIGVHIRSWIDEPTRHAILHDTRIFINEMKKHEAVNFYVCSDSESVIDELKNEFPQRILYRPIKHNRHITFEQSAAAGIDAVVDLLLLSKCRKIIGSYESTFTECAWWIGKCKQPVTIPQTEKLKEIIKGAKHAKSI